MSQEVNENVKADEQPLKRYGVRLKAFQYLSYIILVFSGVFLLDATTSANVAANADRISIGIMGLIGGGFIFYFGRKQRKFLIFADRIEYWTSKCEFEATWNELELVKSFQELDKKPEYLVLMTSDNRVLKISTSFFDRELLIAVFLDLLAISKNNEFMTIEDDLAWSNEKTFDSERL